MKKIVISFFVLVFGFISLQAIEVDELSGDKGTACEVILCLSSSAGRPGECKKPLFKYFSIVGDHRKSTAQKRKEFLNLCPDGGGSDSKYNSLKNTLGEQKFECTAEEFNLDKHKDVQNGAGNSNKYRTMSTTPDFCKKLSNEDYSDLSLPEYTCNKEWYAAIDWRNGYTVKQVSKSDYDTWLASGNDGHTEPYDNEASCSINIRDRNSCIRYFNHYPIKKNCWIDTGSKSGGLSGSSNYGNTNPLEEVKNSLQYNSTVREINSMTNAEKSKYNNNLKQLEHSEEYQNYGSNLKKLEQSKEYRDYDDNLEELKKSSDWDSYGIRRQEIEQSQQYKALSNE